MKVKLKSIALLCKDTTAPISLVRALVREGISQITLFGTIQERPVVEMVENGYIGWIKREPLDGDAANYQFSIIVSTDDGWNLNMYSRISNMNRLVSVYGNTQLQDILLNTSESVEPFSGDEKNYTSLKGIQPTAETDDGEIRNSTDGNSDDDDSQVTTVNEERKPKLYLVGVGPGDPDLMTVKASNLLNSIPVIISDRLVSRDLFKDLNPKTKILFSKKICGKAQEAQKQINDWIIEYLSLGMDVLRVKGGDPFVFGRGGEEWNLAKKHGYQVEWVPGISSCISAPGSFGIPVTHRGVADSFVVATGQKEDGSWSGVPQFSPTRTLVLLMAIGVLDKLEKQLTTNHGYPSNVPVAVIHKATLPDQQVVYGSLNDISTRIKEFNIKSHATVVIGNVVNSLL